MRKPDADDDTTYGNPWYKTTTFKVWVFTFIIFGLLAGFFYSIIPNNHDEEIAEKHHWTAADGPHQQRQISYTAGMALLANKQVEKVTEDISDIQTTLVVNLVLKNGAHRWFVSTNTTYLSNAIAASGANLTIFNADTLAEITSFVSLATSGLVAIVFGLISINMIRKFFSSPLKLIKPNKNGVRFSDIAGQDEAVAQLTEIVDILKNPAKYQSKGIKLPAGCLLVGPAGMGKTLLAKALAAEANVPFLYGAGSDFLEILAGLGSRRVRGMFKAARRQGKCIIFIDEIDVATATRGNGGASDVQSEKDQIVTAMLNELDGMAGRPGVILIGATNRPDIIDPAIKRPGRIDRQIDILPPDAISHGQILRIHTKNLNIDPTVDLDQLARSMPGASGAELANLSNEAALVAAKENAPVSYRHFQAARDKILMGAPRPQAILHPKERKLTAIHEAGHAIAAVCLPELDPIYKASIIPRGRTLGMVVQIPEHDWHTTSRAKIAQTLILFMAGRAAEELINGVDHISSGAQQDIQEATKLARMAIGRLGMHDDLGIMDYIGSQQNVRELAENTSNDLDQAIRHAVKTAYKNAQSLLTANQAAHEHLTSALLEKDELSRDDVLEIIKYHGRTNPIFLDPWKLPTDTQTHAVSAIG
jgi:cell division protease FtsH